MSYLTEARYVGDIIKWMIDPDYCIEAITLDATDIAAGTALAAGDLLEPGSDTDQFQVLGTAANVTGILLGVFGPATEPTNDLQGAYEMDDPAVNLAALALVRGPARVDHAYLDYQSETESTVDAALLVLGIMVVTGPTYSTLASP